MVFGFGRKKARSSGDGPAAFEEAALEHLDALFGAALRLTRNESEAQDLVQDALVRAYRFQHHFEPGTNLKAWLLRILTNTFINHYRRSARERRVLDVEEGAPDRRRRDEPRRHAQPDRLHVGGPGGAFARGDRGGHR